MHAAFGDVLFAFVEQGQMWLSPTYHKQPDWWQVSLDEERLQQNGTLDYGQALLEAYLRAHPGEDQRVGKSQILSIILRALDTV